MAAPPEKTLKNLNGKWVMNKTLSAKTDEILKLQGVGWILRKTIGVATVTLDMKQFDGETGATHIDIKQQTTGGLEGTTELRVLDWSERAHSDFIFGDVKGRSKWTKLDALEQGFGGEDKEWLTKDWEEAEQYVLSWVINEKGGWTATQIWGFQTINGERRHVRNVVVKTAKQSIQTKLVYDYVPGSGS